MSTKKDKNSKKSKGSYFIEQIAVRAIAFGGGSLGKEELQRGLCDSLSAKGGAMEEFKRIALVAHDNRKRDLAEWVAWNWKTLLHHRIICTGTTGRLVESTLLKQIPAGEAVTNPIVKDYADYIARSIEP